MAKKIKNLEMNKFTYEIVCNIGNYQSIRIGGEWSVTDTPTSEQVIAIAYSDLIKENGKPIEELKDKLPHKEKPKDTQNKDLPKIPNQKS